MANHTKYEKIAVAKQLAMQTISLPLSNQPSFFLPLHKNENASDPGVLSNLLYILCANFDETNWWYHLRQGRVGRQSQEVRGCCNPDSCFETKRRHCKTSMHDMELPFTGYIRITISLLKRKNRECSELSAQKFRILTYFSRKSQFSISHVT